MDQWYKFMCIITVAALDRFVIISRLHSAMNNKSSCIASITSLCRDNSTNLSGPLFMPFSKTFALSMGVDILTQKKFCAFKFFSQNVESTWFQIHELEFSRSMSIAFILSSHTLNCRTFFKLSNWRCLQNRPTTRNDLYCCLSYCVNTRHETKRG